MPKTYLRNYKCQECGKKIDDSKSEVGLIAQHFCSNKCYEIFQARNRKRLREQRQEEEYWRNTRPPVQEY